MLHADGSLPDEITLPGLYDGILRGVISGRWHEKEASPAWARDPTLCEGVLRHLAAMAWRLFVEQPGPNEFLHSRAVDAFGKVGTPTLVPQVRGSEELIPLTAEKLLLDLRATGLIVLATPTEREQSREAAYSFAHRTLFEYLAAWYVHLDHLKDRSWRGPGKQPPGWKANSASAGLLRWVLEEEKPFHFRPEWLQFLTFTAALLGDASPLLDALEREPEDIFRQMFGLQCHLLAAAPRTHAAPIENSRRFIRFHSFSDLTRARPEGSDAGEAP